MSFKERLREARLKINLSKEDFAKKIGVSESAIGNYEAGASFPKTEVLYKIFDALETTPNFLFQDFSLKTKEELTINEFDLIKKYRELDDFGKRLIDSAIDIEYDRCINIEEKNVSSTIIKIPLADLSLSAGQGNFFLDASYDIIEVDGKKYPKADIAFRISGDSMEPRYFDGDIAFIHKQDIVNAGEIGAFLYNNNQYLKKLIQKKGKYYLHSLNPNYDDIEINNDTLITYGKVLN